VPADGFQYALPVVGRQPAPHPEAGEQKRDRESAGDEHARIVAQRAQVGMCDMSQNGMPAAFAGRSIS
jgi:hypothetical protein